MAVVIYTEEEGVYIGHAMGFGFWSNLDPADQPAATTFADEKEAEEHMATWECGRPDGVMLVPVEADENGYASIEACVRAGLPGWITSQTETANTAPC